MICKELADKLLSSDRVKDQTVDYNVIEKDNKCIVEFKFRDKRQNFSGDKNIMECDDDICNVRIRAGLYNGYIPILNYKMTFEGCRSKSVNVYSSNTPYMDIDAYKCPADTAHDIFLLSTAISTGEHELFPKRKIKFIW